MLDFINLVIAIANLIAALILLRVALYEYSQAKNE